MALPQRSGTRPAPDSGDLLLVAAGDEAALLRLSGRWRQPLYAFFERVKEPSAAAEATVETLERVARAAARFDPGQSFPRFLWSHAARVAQEFLPAPAVSVSAARLAESAAARTALQRAAVAALPPVERAAFLLARVARLPLSTAADALGLGDAEFRRRLVRALETLRLTLRPLIEPEGEGAAEPEREPPAGVVP